MKSFQFEQLYKSLIGDIGETVTLRRVSGAYAGDYSVRARIFDANVLSANPQISQLKRTAIVLATDIVESGFPTPFIPKQDRIIWGRSSRNSLQWGQDEPVVWDSTDMDFPGGQINSVILSVDDTTRRVNGVMMAYVLELSGA